MKLTFVQKKAYKIGCATAAAIWPFMKKRRMISIDNIIKANVADNVLDAKRIAYKSWCHMAGHIAEALFVPKVITAENWSEHLDTSAAHPKAVKLLLETPDEPIILVSAHHGVWEAATNLLSFVRPMIAIARVLNNKFAANWMKKHHFRGPVTIIDKNRGFTPAIMHQWKETRAAMTILMDQHTSKGLPLKFFGRDAKTFTTATRLAMRSGAGIVVGSFVRVAPYKYKIIGDEPLYFGKDADIAVSTQILNDRLEKAIRQYPEQYLWAHKRWR
jgi:KDO2-lipid IV(A) lauroyltransferase